MNDQQLLRYSRHILLDEIGIEGQQRLLDAKVLVVGWGSSYGPISAAARRVRLSGRSVATVHLRHLNPLPANTGDVLRRYRRVLVPEMNLGQLTVLLRSRYLVDAVGFNRVRGLPFTSTEIAEAITKFAQEGTL